jgi:hypothetical protein
MIKHSQLLSSPPTRSDPDLDAARRFARTFFKGFRIPKIFNSLPKVEGSLRACVENSRSTGGAREHLRMLTSSIQGVPLDSDTFIRMVQPDGSQVIEERGLPPLSPDQWRDLTKTYTPAVSRSFLNLGVKRKAALIRVLQSKPKAWNFPTARVAEVLEPLKVRLITAMDAVRSHVARPLQEALFRHLRSSPVFQLIGEPVTEAILHDLVRRHRERGGGEDPFVSGDYSAATDGLDIRLSKVIFEELVPLFDPEDLPYVDFIRSVLFEQVILYPPWTGIDPVVQENGQLMGSVLSFPFLCLANLFAYIQSLPDREQVLLSRSMMDRLPVLINGDDILFRCSDPHYDRWLQEIDRVGFVPSVGKNFRHPRFFTVNSVPMEYLPAPSPYTYWKGFSWADMEESSVPWQTSIVPKITIRGFLNVGLLTGQAKLTGRESLGALPLSGWHAGAVLEALNPSQAHHWFVKYHRKEIVSQTKFGRTTLNLFAHPLLGGLGFSVPSGIEPRFSPEQRRLARSLFLSASYTYEGQESDFRLDSLVFLESDVAMPMSSLGRKQRRVEVQLYPLGTPLPEGFESFKDSSGILPLAMAHSVEPEGEGSSKGLRARCRLSSKRLHSLTDRFAVDRADLHPVDKMTEFPFTPVKVSRSTFVPLEASNPNDASKFQERKFSRVYVPDSPFQDISPSVLDDSLEIPVSIPEDWESEQITLRLVSSPAEVLPPIRNRKGSERRRQSMIRESLNKGIIIG